MSFKIQNQSIHTILSLKRAKAMQCNIIIFYGHIDIIVTWGGLYYHYHQGEV